MPEETDASLLLQLTRRMLELAEAQAWDELVATEQQRQPVMDRVFSRGVQGREALAREILDLDARTMALAKDRVHYLHGQFQVEGRASKAQQAYQAVQDMEPDKG